MRSRLLAFALLACGCGGTTNNYYFLDGGSGGGGGGGGGNDGGGGGGPLCTAGAKDCVTPALARICAPDGMAWIGLQCDAGYTCSNGDCVFDPNNTSCNPGDAVCVSATQVAVCNSAGTAYVTMSCPGTSQCGGGQCIGACTVGESKCDSTGAYVLTCSDGTTFTPMACPANNYCVSASGISPPQAFCIAATVCQPDVINGCDTVCGDKTNASNDQTKYTSTCVPTATGYQWQVTQCPSSQSCDPGGGPTCGSSTQAGCRGNCVPGQVRCGADGVSTETCDATGNWGANTPCDVASGQVCNYNATQNAQCYDAVCSTGAVGICVLDAGVSKLRPCVNGKLAEPSAIMACAKGLCAPDPSVMPPPSGQPGKCVVECQKGDLKCVGNATQGCSDSGTWNITTTPCALACIDYTNAAGRPAAVCGVCYPGTHQCTDAGGNMGTTGGYIQTCGADGMWGASVACATGYSCADNPALLDSSCQQQCVPGAKLCMGAALTVGGNAIAGTVQSATCPASGLISDATGANCPTGQSCRTDQAGNPLGCVPCVGGMNENGLTDTRCTDVNGTATAGDFVQTCKSDSSGWNSVGLVDCGGQGLTCQNAAPKQALQACGACPGTSFTPCTDSRILQTTGLYGCADFGFGAPVGCGASPDCCANACLANNPAPATCQP